MKAFILTLGVVVALAGVTTAASFTVETAQDTHDLLPGDGVCGSGTGDCSLRAAIEECNALSGADTIIITSNVSPVRLEMGPLNIEDNATLLTGDGTAPVIDGFLNPYRSASLVIHSDSNCVSGVWFRRSRGEAVLVLGNFNDIGELTSDRRTVFSGNCVDNSDVGAITLRQSSRNYVVNCLIGVYGNGSLVDGNAIGVLMSDADSNVIGTTDSSLANVVAGQTGWGIVITRGSIANSLIGNLIGLDASGLYAAPNQAGGVLLSDGSYKNVVGGSLAGEANFITGNGGDGVRVINVGTSKNSIYGNYIGFDISRFTGLGNRGAGIRIAAGASENTIGGLTVAGRNLIGSNDYDGIVIEGSGTELNSVAGNIIGLDYRGLRYRGNGRVEGNGVTIREGARDNTVGSRLWYGSNVISGQFGDGIVIDGIGTSSNAVIGNFIGTGISGFYSAGNRTAVAIRAGASGNRIGGDSPVERNIISGSYGSPFPYGAGVYLVGDGTAYNTVSGNFIGTDTSGTRAIRNATTGVILGPGASHNQIGGSGPGEGNLISGNGYGELIESLAGGIHLYGPGTDGNTIQGNVIGLMVDGIQSLFNWRHGIGIFGGAGNNIIGGDAPQAGNIIATNTWSGIYISDSLTSGNTMRFNRIYGNDSAEIFVAAGAQDGIQPPVIDHATNSVTTGSGALPLSTIDIYQASADPDFRGGAVSHIGTGTVSDSGTFVIPTSFVPSGDSVTAIMTDFFGNSSAFALNRAVDVSTGTGPGDEPNNIPASYALFQNYPNPFNPTSTITFALPKASFVRIDVYDMLGRKVRSLASSQYTAGAHSVVWDGTDERGQQTASGVYLYRINAGDFTSSRKMILLR